MEHILYTHSRVNHKNYFIIQLITWNLNMHMQQFCLIKNILPPRWKQSSSECHTFLMCPLHPLQVWEVRFDLRVIIRLRVEMTKRDIHAAKLALKNRRATSVWARVVLAGRPSLLHAGRVVQRLGLAVSKPRPLTWVHAVFPTALHRVASHPSVRHLIHVW